MNIPGNDITVTVGSFLSPVTAEDAWVPGSSGPRSWVPGSPGPRVHCL